MRTSLKPSIFHPLRKEIRWRRLRVVAMWLLGISATVPIEKSLTVVDAEEPKRIGKQGDEMEGRPTCLVCGATGPHKAHSADEVRGAMIMWEAAKQRHPAGRRLRHDRPVPLPPESHRES